MFPSLLSAQKVQKRCCIAIRKDDDDDSNEIDNKGDQVSIGYLCLPSNDLWIFILLSMVFLS